jgi:hypothetical protein
MSEGGNSTWSRSRRGGKDARFVQIARVEAMVSRVLGRLRRGLIKLDQPWLGIPFHAAPMLPAVSVLAATREAAQLAVVAGAPSSCGRGSRNTVICHMLMAWLSIV